MRNYSSFIFVAAVCFIWFSCSPQTDEVPVQSVNDEGQQYWDVDSSLEWDDYKKIPRGNEPHDAGSFVGLTWYIYFDANEYLVAIHAYFQPDSSVVKVESASARLLSHEQVHFNLAEIAARSARMKISNWPGPGDFDSFARLTIDTVRAELLQAHIEYDSLTQHGLRLNTQAEWKRRTDSVLRSLDNYSDPTARVESSRGYYRRD